MKRISKCVRKFTNLFKMGGHQSKDGKQGNEQTVQLAVEDEGSTIAHLSNNLSNELPELVPKCGNALSRPFNQPSEQAKHRNPVIEDDSKGSDIHKRPIERSISKGTYHKTKKNNSSSKAKATTRLKNMKKFGQSGNNTAKTAIIEDYSKPSSVSASNDGKSFINLEKKSTDDLITLTKYEPIPSYSKLSQIQIKQPSSYTQLAETTDNRKSFNIVNFQDHDKVIYEAEIQATHPKQVGHNPGINKAEQPKTQTKQLGTEPAQCKSQFKQILFKPSKLKSKPQNVADKLPLQTNVEHNTLSNDTPMNRKLCLQDKEKANTTKNGTIQTHNSTVGLHQQNKEQYEYVFMSKFKKSPIIKPTQVNNPISSQHTRSFPSEKCHPDIGIKAEEDITAEITVKLGQLKLENGSPSKHTISSMSSIKPRNRIRTEENQTKEVETQEISSVVADDKTQINKCPSQTHKLLNPVSTFLSSNRVLPNNSELPKTSKLKCNIQNKIQRTHRSNQTNDNVLRSDLAKAKVHQVVTSTNVNTQSTEKNIKCPINPIKNVADKISGKPMRCTSSIDINMLSIIASDKPEVEPCKITTNTETIKPKNTKIPEINNTLTKDLCQNSSKSKFNVKVHPKLENNNEGIQTSAEEHAPEKKGGGKMHINNVGLSNNITKEKQVPLSPTKQCDVKEIQPRTENKKSHQNECQTVTKIKPISRELKSKIEMELIKSLVAKEIRHDSSKFLARYTTNVPLKVHIHQKTENVRDRPKADIPMKTVTSNATVQVANTGSVCQTKTIQSNQHEGTKTTTTTIKKATTNIKELSKVDVLSRENQQSALNGNKTEKSKLTLSAYPNKKQDAEVINFFNKSGRLVDDIASVLKEHFKGGDAAHELLVIMNDFTRQIPTNSRCFISQIGQNAQHDYWPEKLLIQGPRRKGRCEIEFDMRNEKVVASSAILYSKHLQNSLQGAIDGISEKKPFDVFRRAQFKLIVRKTGTEKRNRFACLPFMFPNFTDISGKYNEAVSHTHVFDETTKLLYSVRISTLPIDNLINVDNGAKTDTFYAVKVSIADTIRKNVVCGRYVQADNKIPVMPMPYGKGESWIFEEKESGRHYQVTYRGKKEDINVTKVKVLKRVVFAEAECTISSRNANEGANEGKIAKTSVLDNVPGTDLKDSENKNSNTRATDINNVTQAVVSVKKQLDTHDKKDEEPKCIADADQKKKKKPRRRRRKKTILPPLASPKREADDIAENKVEKDDKPSEEDDVKTDINDEIHSDKSSDDEEDWDFDFDSDDEYFWHPNKYDRTLGAERYRLISKPTKRLIKKSKRRVRNRNGKVTTQVTTTLDVRFCDACAKAVFPPYHPCKMECDTNFYCNLKCFNRHWPIHKKECKKTIKCECGKLR
ncbi:uncharacterized protein LOC117100727 [Anneissia japonica]|uniref:uncharacterized protein LOC117100727 n=1 Tax=Anneissia japonica TaxID=1529436 RepID=UPI001425B361|nr:uncharacterized protein LOC117100727 [Anneissia japonica]